MSEWKEYMFTEVATLTNGRAYLQPELQDSGKYRIVRVGNLSGGDKWFYSDMELPDNKYCNKGDLLYAWACSFGPYIWNDEKTIYHYHIWKVDVNATVADKMFLYYYLKYYTPKWMGLTNGSVMMHITKGSLEKQKISLPPLETQQRISSILSSLDSKIENNRKICANLEAQAQALFKHWFIDFAPFKDGKFVESELGMIPEGWRVGTFTEIFNLCPGGTPKTSESSYWENGNIPFFSPKDVTGIYCFKTEKQITKEGLNNCSSRLYDTNTVLITCRGTVGKVTMSAVPMAMNQSNYAILAKEGYSQYYAYLMTVAIVRKLKFKAVGSVFDAITSTDFNEKIIIPDFATLKSFDSLISTFFEEIKAKGFESSRLSTLRDTLLPKLMSGEIKV